MSLGRIPGGVMGVVWTIICCVVVSMLAVGGAVVGCTKDAISGEPTDACHCDVGGFAKCECDPCKCGESQAVHLTQRGLDPVEQSRLRDRESIAIHERRIRQLEQRIVELQRIIYRNPRIPMPQYRDPLPPLPDIFPDGFPFGEAGPIGEAPPASDDGKAEIIEAPGVDDASEAKAVTPSHPFDIKPNEVLVGYQLFNDWEITPEGKELLRTKPKREDYFK